MSQDTHVKPLDGKDSWLIDRLIEEVLDDAIGSAKARLDAADWIPEDAPLDVFDDYLWAVLGEVGSHLVSDEALKRLEIEAVLP